MRKWFLFFVVCGGLFYSANGAVVDKIVVKGTMRIDRSFVLSHVPFKKGQDISAEGLQKMLRDLFATGMFSDVKGNISGRTLYLNVTENQVLNQVVCEGNKKIDSEDILKELDIKPRQIYTPYRVQKAAQRIKELYRLRGNVGVVVAPKIIRRSQGRVDLIFEIQDGRPQKIQSILFQGNQKISDDDLKSAILTRESRWWRFLSSADTYEPDRLTYDRELLFRYYRNQGYADVDVTSVLTELSPNQQYFYITFHIQEGDVYNFGRVTVESKAPHIKVVPLKKILENQRWKKFNQAQIESVNQELNRVLSEEGHFCGVDADIRQNKKARTIDVTFVVVPRKPLYVGSVLINGNVATNDNVIRREAILSPGDPLTPFKVDRTRQRVSNLDFFKKVDISVEDVPGSEDKKDVVIEVEDKSTGELMFSGGYSTSDGPLFEVRASERNFLGRGQETEIKGTVAKRSKSVVLGFTEPYFLNRRLQAGVDGFYQHLQQDTLGNFEGGYVRKSYGASTRTGFYLGTSLLERFRYTASKERFKDNKARSVFYSQMGNDFKSLLGHDLIYDKRDSVINPTKGGYCVLSTNYAGVGGNVKFFQNDLTFGYYWAFDDDGDLVFRVRARYGVLMACGKPLRVTDHFFMGGESVRGFEDVGIGPRDDATGDALGGKQTFFTNFELSHPLGKKSYGLSGYIFNDWGSLWSSGLTSGPNGDLVIGDGFAIRMSVGLGMRYQSPLGLVGFSVGFPLKKVANVDKKHIFRFNIGTEF